MYFPSVIAIPFITIETTNSLRLSKLIIPSVKFRGENVLLECQYELNNHRNISNYVYENGRYHRRNNYFYDNEEDEEVIYSVKWYKDGEEFYRFVPKAKQPQVSYNFDGIRVDVSLFQKHHEVNLTSFLFFHPTYLA